MTANENKYNHPYQPYDIQVQLMDAIYAVLSDDAKIGIFESPTGTGKTLSIICSTMKWLRDYKERNILGNQGDNGDFEDEEDWVKEAFKTSIVARTKGKLIDYERHLAEIEKALTSKKQTLLSLEQTKKKIRREPETVDENEKYIPQDYQSDPETEGGLTLEVKRLIKRAEGKVEEQQDENPVKIFFASRTHSQLIQFANQLALPAFKSSIAGVNERTKYVPLGSRNQLCVNKKVNHFKDDQMLNDACLDLQKLKEGCEYLHRNDPGLTKDFIDTSFTKVHDIEELASLGQYLKTCPYYTSREGISHAEVVSLPYQAILDKRTRDFLNIDIEGSILVIDEAHNLLDVINSMNSASISGEELKLVIGSLKTYLAKFSRRLNGGNRVNLMKLIKLCQVIQTFIEEKMKVSRNEALEVHLHDIFQSSSVDLINVFKLEQYLDSSKIAYKIESYMEQETQRKLSNSNPLLFKVMKFLKCFNNPSHEGKMFWESKDGKPSLHYILLDPSEVFREVVDKTKSILLCGGTMEPMSDYMEFLFPQVDKLKVATFSCGHIIPHENLKVFPITNYLGNPFYFLYSNRQNENMVQNLGTAILEISKKVPYGVVVFFSSYKYLDFVYKSMKAVGILQQLCTIKSIFCESSSSGESEKMLKQYNTIINEKREGGILFAVVGGKLSEGINFSNDLARGVVMVGLPYPNAFSNELVARRKFIESSALQKGESLQNAKRKSNEFYENICMRAINQSVGRSIRHSNDYAIIYLIDQRYSHLLFQKKLSGWVRERLVNGCEMPSVLESTEDFFLARALSKNE